MRRTTAPLLGLLLVLAVAGCGADDGDGVATAGGSAEPASSAGADGLTDREQLLRFADCMRENGVPEFTDPEVGEDGGIQMKVPEGTPRETVDAAMEKCKQHLPDGGEPPKVDPEALKKMREFAKCMRENGVPKFPDPRPDGGLDVDAGKIGMEPDDPRMKKAEKACAKYGPPQRPRRDEK